MHASVNSQVRWIGTPVAHSKLTIAIQACFPGVRWESAPGPSEFASMLRRMMLTTCAFWDGQFGAMFSTGPYGPNGESVSLVAWLSRYRMGGVGMWSRVAAMLRVPILNPLRRRLSWSFDALMGLTGEPWSPGGESYLLGKELTVPADLYASFEQYRHRDLSRRNLPQRCSDSKRGRGLLRPLPIDVDLRTKRTSLAFPNYELARSGWVDLAELVRFCGLRRTELRRRSVARGPRITSIFDWWVGRFRVSQVEKAISRQEWASQMEVTWRRSKCSKSSIAGSTLPPPGRREGHCPEVVARGGAASGYRGDRHT